MVTVSIFMQQKYFFLFVFASNWSCSGRSHIGSIFDIKKKKAQEVINTFARHAGLVRDVTYTNCQTQNGGAHDGRVLTTFKRRI